MRTWFINIVSACKPSPPPTYRYEFIETSFCSRLQCELEAIKCPVRSSTSESRVLFSLLAPPQQGFLTSEIGFNERSSSHVEHSTVLVENPSSSPSPLSVPQHPSRGRNTDRCGPLVALKSFPPPEVGTIQNQIQKFQSNQILTCTNQIRNKIQHIRQDCDQIQSSIKSNFFY